MSTTKHERPGVYSSYDTSSVVSAGNTPKVVGIAAKAERGTPGQAVTLTSHAAGAAAFGGGMEQLLRLLFANGASTVVAVRVNDAGTLEDYQEAFAALAAQEQVQVAVCDSAETEVHQALRDSVETASAARRERIAVVGGADETAAELVSHAKALNSERVVLAGPDGSAGGSRTASGVLSAAALAGAIASNRDPAAPMNGVALAGLETLAADYQDNDIDLLVRGGVTPLESRAGTISPVRCVTTRTTTGQEPDATWRELTTMLIVDDVIPAVRSALRSKFVRAKNTAQSRGAIRAQVIVELERKKAAEIITEYGEVTAEPSTDDPAVCLVAFTFAVAHGLNQIYLTAHITV